MSCDPNELEKWKSLKKDLVTFKSQLNSVVSPRSFSDDTNQLEADLQAWTETKQQTEELLNHSLVVLQRRLDKLKAIGDELDTFIQKTPVRLTKFYNWLKVYDEVRSQYWPLIYDLQSKYGKIP